MEHRLIMAGKGFSITLKGGRPISGDKLADLVAPHVKRAGLVVQGGIQTASPVKTGTLRRSWNTGEPAKVGGSVGVKVGTNIVYARYQNERTRNKGYVRRGIEAVKEQAAGALRDGIRGDMSKLWDKNAK